ncbi:MAG: phosphotransferase enzyme family protein [Bacillota bacterium]
MDFASLLESWPLTGTPQLQPTEGGWNNLSRLVTANEGRFVLRLYQNTANPERVRFEHELLTRLAAEGLPFDVPAPVATRTGESLVTTSEGALAALFRLIPGTGAEGLNLAHARAAGEAQARLHRAMARVGRIPVGCPPTGYARLDLVHPLVAEPLEAAEFIGVEPQRLRAIIEELQPAVERIYGSLPLQVIHGDYARSNILLVGDRVTGVLDFEFASYDLRATDLAVGLYPFALGHLESGEHWRLLDAYMAGYGSVQRLTRDEVEGLPTLLRLVRVVSLLHWTGRTRQGLYSLPELQERAVSLLAFSDWLDDHLPEVQDRVAQIG